MAIATIAENDRKERFIATAGQTVFPYDFPIYAAADLQVRRERAGAITLLTLGTDYSVTGVQNQTGGNVVLTTGANAGDIIVILSAMSTARAAQFVNGGDLAAAALEAELNRIRILFQQNARDGRNALLFPPTDPAMQDLPPIALRANRFLAFDGNGQPYAATPAAGTVLDAISRLGDNMSGPLGFAPGTANAPGLRPNNENATGIYLPSPGVLAMSISGNEVIRINSQGISGPANSPASNVINYKAPATFAITRSIQSVLQEGLSIGDFDSSPSLNNGVYDATLAMQRLAAECAANGFVGKLPAGKFSISASVLFDEQNTAVVSDRRGSLRGAGIAQTEIRAQSNGNYVALNFLGSATAGGIGLGIKPGGFLLSGPETNVGIGLQFNQYAFWSMDEIFVKGFDIGVNAIDVLSVQMANLFIRNNRRGLVAAYENFSRPNAWTLTNVDFGLNTEYAASISEAALFSIDGGAVQGNGIGGTGVFGYRGGIAVINAGTEGAIGVNLRNVYFEYNAGDSDISITGTQQTAVHNLYGCNFLKLDAANFVTNNIRIDVASPAINTINIDSCGFEHAGSYTPSAARPYVNVSAINGAVNDLGGNYFASDLEYMDLIKFGAGTRSGSIPATGTGATLPRGWSVTKTGTGTYQVTHNLGTTAYRVAAVSVDGNPNLVQRVFKGTNSFTIVTTNASGTPADCATDFTINK